MTIGNDKLIVGGGVRKAKPKDIELKAIAHEDQKENLSGEGG